MLGVLRGEAVLRGLGGPVKKSAALLSVSVRPPSIRDKANILLVPGAAAPSKKFAEPHPTRSMICASEAGGQGVEPPLHPSDTVVLPSATLAPVALIFIGLASVTSGMDGG